MIELNINKDQIDRSKELYSFNNLNGSITNGKSQLYGAIGEIVVFDFFKDRSVYFKQTYNYDMVIDGYKIDVKTKKTTVRPKNFYLCSISDFNIHQKCDYYFFVRVMSCFSKCFLLGYIKKESFFDKSFYKRKGENDINGFIFKDNCYNLEIKKLTKFRG